MGEGDTVTAIATINKDHLEKTGWKGVEDCLNRSITDIKGADATIDSVEVREREKYIDFKFDCKKLK